MADGPGLGGSNSSCYWWCRPSPDGANLDVRQYAGDAGKSRDGVCKKCQQFEYTKASRFISRFEYSKASRFISRFEYSKTSLFYNFAARVFET
ncbi:hypothetical protein ElyMa_003030400 [Elysia marginata]|uniref:Uncharacterized protein n=1 Tax=Elysia marginata TaxID=1093978 RepID=A0AAV4IK04_9GAST|nr:hypothetical protein ElyMa_003030400 [Elysia marginata]